MISEERECDEFGYEFEEYHIQDEFCVNRNGDCVMCKYAPTCEWHRLDKEYQLRYVPPTGQ